MTSEAQGRYRMPMGPRTEDETAFVESLVGAVEEAKRDIEAIRRRGLVQAAFRGLSEERQLAALSAVGIEVNFEEQHG